MPRSSSSFAAAPRPPPPSLLPRAARPRRSASGGEGGAWGELGGTDRGNARSWLSIASQGYGLYQQRGTAPTSGQQAARQAGRQAEEEAEGQIRGGSLGRVSFVQQCKTTGCRSPAHFIQKNGKCTVCNSETRRASMEASGKRNADRKRWKRNAAGRKEAALDWDILGDDDDGDGDGGPLSAFGGRLRFSPAPPRPAASAYAHRGRPPPSKKEVIDHHLLRLKFLLGKAAGNGVAPGEMFGHFDTDGDGEIDYVELKEGLEKLGIKPTEPEARGLMKRLAGGPFSPQRPGGGTEAAAEAEAAVLFVTTDDFLRSLDLDRSRRRRQRAGLEGGEGEDAPAASAAPGASSGKEAGAGKAVRITEPGRGGGGVISSSLREKKAANAARMARVEAASKAIRESRARIEARRQIAEQLQKLNESRGQTAREVKQKADRLMTAEEAARSGLAGGFLR